MPPSSGSTHATVSTAASSKPSSSTDSSTLASYVTNYRIENGRRYHSYQDGSYWGPNDDPANEAQHLAHEMYHLTLSQNLHLAPINPQSTSSFQILDIGTGTGIWAIETADLYPSATVTGTDLSPIQPDLVPPNCIFEIDDANLPMTWPDNHFDYVHIREMFGSIKDWKTFLKEVWRCTKPGGWVEVVEHGTWPVADDGSVGEGHFFNTWGRVVQETGRKWGKSFDVWKESRALLQDAGFVDVKKKKFQWPVNGWPKDPKQKQLGEMNLSRMLENMEGYVMRVLTTAAGWTPEQAQLHMAQMRMALKDTRVHAYLPVTVVYGRTPG